MSHINDKKIKIILKSVVIQYIYIIFAETIKQTKNNYYETFI